MNVKLSNILVMVLAASLSGCTSFSSLNPFAKNKIAFATADDPAIEVVCLWEPGEGRDERGIPSRGFNGQLLFFTRNNDAPVVVDGDVKIYQFDEYGPPENWSKPIAEYDFASQDWNSLLAGGMLGPGYHVFIPYGRQHAEQINVTLQVRFIPRDGGRPLYSRLIKSTLPGTLQSEQHADKMRRYTEIRDAERTGFQDIVNREMDGLAAQHPKADPRVHTIHRFEQPRFAATGVAAPEESPIQQLDFEAPPADDAPLFENEQPESTRRRFEFSAMHSTTN